MYNVMQTTHYSTYLIISVYVTNNVIDVDILCLTRLWNSGGQHIYIYIYIYIYCFDYKIRPIYE